MTKERISFTFDPRDMLLSLQMGFSFVRAAVACAILERTSGLEPSSETTAPRYLKLVTVPNFCPFTFISLWHCLSSVWSSLHWSPSYTLCRFCRDFLLELLAPALPQLEHLCHRQTEIGNISATYANLPIMFFQGIRHDPFEKNVEEGGWQKTSLPYSDCCSEPFSNAAIHLDCTYSLVIELLNGAN